MGMTAGVAASPLPLNPTECRVLGVLIEKAQTVPASYPMTLNALVNGCNQKNNRDPVVTWPEERVQQAVDTLRAKGIVREVRLSTDRVAKYRHTARETLGLTTEQVCVLAELLLRGPQTVGAIRGNASRMVALESIETVQALLESLINHQPPGPDAQAGAAGAVWQLGSLVKELPAPPGSRARLYQQLLNPGLHPVPTVGAGGHDEQSDTGEGGEDRGQRPASGEDSAEVRVLSERVAKLEAEVEGLKAKLAALGV